MVNPPAFTPARPRARLLYIVDAPHVPGEPGSGSNRYRCHHPAEVLRSVGHRACVTSLDRLDRATLAAHDAVAFLRPAWNARLARALTSCRTLRLSTWCDFDDLLFEPSLADQSPRAINGFASVPATAAEFARHRRALLAFDRVSVSTQVLARAVNRAHPAAQVQRIANGLSAHWLQAGPPPHTPSAQRLTYLSGTRSHDHDMLQLLPALERALQRHPQLKLRIVGPLAFDRSRLPADRLEHLPHVDYYRLPHYLADATASLAPLADTVFNAAKSRVKTIESLAFGTPLIASPNADLPADADGLLVADDAGDRQSTWDAAIDTALAIGQDPAHRLRIREAARDRFGAQETLATLEALLHADHATGVARAA